MRKFDFNIWSQENTIDTENNDLPNFINISNLFIKNKNNINIFDVNMLSKQTRLDSLIFEKYGGFNLIEQFNVIKIVLPLVLLFNDINDITNIKPGLFLKFPDLNTLIDNIYIYDENNVTIKDSLSFDQKENNVNLLPGLNPLNKYNLKISETVDETKMTGIPAMKLTLDKIKYDNEKGIIFY